MIPDIWKKKENLGGGGMWSGASFTFSCFQLILYHKSNDVWCVKMSIYGINIYVYIYIYIYMYIKIYISVYMYTYTNLHVKIKFFLFSTFSLFFHIWSMYMSIYGIKTLVFAVIAPLGYCGKLGLKWLKTHKFQEFDFPTEKLSRSPLSAPSQECRLL